MKIRNIIIFAVMELLIINFLFSSEAVVKPDVDVILPPPRPHACLVPKDPLILEYKHKLYITSIAETTFPKNMIGYYVNTPVYSACYYDINKVICLRAKYEYSRYNYICDDSFVLNHIQYHLIGVIGSDIYNLFPIIGYKSNAVGIIDDNDYFLNWFPFVNYDPKNSIKGLKKIGTVASGTIYEIKGTDPSQAVILNFQRKWLIVQKAKGYKGKKSYSIWQTSIP